MSNIRIQEVDSLELASIIQTKIPRGCFISNIGNFICKSINVCNGLSLWIACDNRVGETWTKEFYSKEEAIDYLLDKSDGEAPMEFNIYTMKLHEVNEIKLKGIDGTATSYTFVIRVPGGWIYQMWDVDKQVYVRDIFVPYNKEFRRIKQ